MLIRKIAMALAMVLGAGVAQAAWPERTVRIVVPYPPGGSDIVMRLIAEGLNEKFGRYFIIENKAGGASIPGSAEVVRAAPDGYTFLFTSTALSANPSLRKIMPYDARISFIPVVRCAIHPFVLLAHPKLNVSSVSDLFALAKSRPGSIHYASVGVGSSQHLEMELLAREAKAEFLHVPYSGAAPAVHDVVGGQVGLMFNGISSSIQLVRNGDVKGLAVDSKVRVPALAEVPTLAESGVPNIDIATWTGLFAPAGAPVEIVDRLADAVEEVLRTPKWRDQITAIGVLPDGTRRAEFARFLESDRIAWKNVIDLVGIQPE